MPKTDPAAYAAEAETFCEAIDREYYLHLAGRKRELEIEPLYERHSGLFDPAAVRNLRERHAAAAAGDQERAARYLLHFAFEGLAGQRTKSLAQEAAHLEVTLEVELGDRKVPYRAVPVELAREADGAVRSELEAARDELLGERINPLHREALEVSHELARELGWPGYADACAELRGIDLEQLGDRLGAVLRATEDRYASLLDPELEAAGVPRLGGLRRCDMPRFFRAPQLDEPFPAARLVGSFRETLAGMGIELDSQPGVELDTEPRPTKSARAFCSTPRVPGEVYLVISPVGGREDYAALFHEGGHTEHYANVDPALPFEFRQLGDNSVTESFAFLFEGLVSTPAWLESALAVSDPKPAFEHWRAANLLMLRRYAAKIAYELELHAPAPDLDAMPGRYAELLGGATRVEWPRVSWLADVDGGFYVACYLRAWALEAIWRQSLRERFGERWFSEPAAGEWLRGLWREGQRLAADELVEQALGRPLDFEPLMDELQSG